MQRESPDKEEKKLADRRLVLQKHRSSRPLTCLVLIKEKMTENPRLYVIFFSRKKNLLSSVLPGERSEAPGGLGARHVL